MQAIPDQSSEGTVSFATGHLAGDFARPVNDRDFDVSLHLVFVNKAAHDKYQDDPRHCKFIEESKDNWEKVRVFDSYLSPVPANSAPATVSRSGTPDPDTVGSLGEAGDLLPEPSLSTAASNGRRRESAL